MATPITPVYNYTVTQDGDYTCLAYTKSPIGYGMLGPLCLLTAVPAVLLTMLSIRHSDGTTLLIVWLVWMFALAAGGVWLINYLRTRERQELRIGLTTISYGDKTYELSHVATMYVHRPPAPTARPSTNMEHIDTRRVGIMPALIMSTVGMINVLVQSSVLGTMQHFKRVQHGVRIRYGTKDAILVKGLTENEAEAMFDKITALTGYQSPA